MEPDLTVTGGNCAVPLQSTSGTVTVSVSTEISGEVTVTVQDAVNAPSKVCAVIMAIPGETAFTVPLLSTVATDSLSEIQSTSFVEALAGLMEGVSLKLSPVRSAFWV